MLRFALKRQAFASSHSTDELVVNRKYRDTLAMRSLGFPVSGEWSYRAFGGRADTCQEGFGCPVGERPLRLAFAYHRLESAVDDKPTTW